MSGFPMMPRLPTLVRCLIDPSPHRMGSHGTYCEHGHPDPSAFWACADPAPEEASESERSAQRDPKNPSGRGD